MKCQKFPDEDALYQCQSCGMVLSEKGVVSFQAGDVYSYFCSNCNGPCGEEIDSSKIPDISVENTELEKKVEIPQKLLDQSSDSSVSAVSDDELNLGNMDDIDLGLDELPDLDIPTQSTTPPAEVDIQTDTEDEIPLPEPEVEIPLPSQDDNEVVESILSSDVYSDEEEEESDSQIGFTAPSSNTEMLETQEAITPLDPSEIPLSAMDELNSMPESQPSVESSQDSTISEEILPKETPKTGTISHDEIETEEITHDEEDDHEVEVNTNSISSIIRASIRMFTQPQSSFPSLLNGLHQSPFQKTFLMSSILLTLFYVASRIGAPLLGQNVAGPGHFNSIIISIIEIIVFATALTFGIKNSGRSESFLVLFLISIQMTLIVLIGRNVVSFGCMIFISTDLAKIIISSFLLFFCLLIGFSLKKGLNVPPLAAFCWPLVGIIFSSTIISILLMTIYSI